MKEAEQTKKQAEEDFDKNLKDIEVKQKEVEQLNADKKNWNLKFQNKKKDLKT